MYNKLSTGKETKKVAHPSWPLRCQGSFGTLEDHILESWQHRRPMPVRKRKYGVSLRASSSPEDEEDEEVDESSDEAGTERIPKKAKTSSSSKGSEGYQKDDLSNKQTNDLAKIEDDKETPTKTFQEEEDQDPGEENLFDLLAQLPTFSTWRVARDRYGNHNHGHHYVVLATSVAADGRVEHPPSRPASTTAERNETQQPQRKVVEVHQDKNNNNKKKANCKVNSRTTRTTTSKKKETQQPQHPQQHNANNNNNDVEPASAKRSFDRRMLKELSYFCFSKFEVKSRVAQQHVFNTGAYESLTSALS